MKRALLLGDSIRMGYQRCVKDLLKDDCEVIYEENDNGRFAAYTLWQVNQLFRKYGRFDVVHWNNGYWDMSLEAPMPEPIHPIGEYLHYLKRIIGEIRRNGAEIIFATTTPVWERGEARDNSGTDTLLKYDDRRVRAYNAAACKLMAENHITVNDLYALTLKGPDYYKGSDRLHLTEEGYRVCAEQIAEVIRKKL